MERTYNIVRGGLYIALTLVLLYMSSIMPTSKLFILGCASCIIPLSIVTTNLKTSFIVYIASCLLSIVLFSFKVSTITYIIFFGLYGFVKYYIERIKKLPIEIILKLAFFNICFWSTYFLYSNVFFKVPKLSIPIEYAIFMFQFVFLIYDYAITLFIGYLNKNIKKFTKYKD